MAKSTERHSRESLSKLGRAYGVNREYIRKCQVLNNINPKLLDDVEKGTINVNNAYNNIIGDYRVPLYVKLPPEIHHQLKQECRKHNVTMGEYVTFIFTQIFGDSDNE